MLTLQQQKLVKWLDAEFKKQRYGTANLTLILKSGDPLLEKVSLIKRKRKKYKAIKTVDKLLNE